MHAHSAQGAHRSLDNLWRKRVSRSGSGKYVSDSKPVSQADYGPQISGVLDGIEGYGHGFSRAIFAGLGNLKDGNYSLRRLLKR